MYQKKHEYEQLDFFTNYEETDEIRKKENIKRQKEKRAQEAMLEIKKRLALPQECILCALICRQIQQRRLCLQKLMS